MDARHAILAEWQTSTILAAVAGMVCLMAVVAAAGAIVRLLFRVAGRWARTALPDEPESQEEQDYTIPSPVGGLYLGRLAGWWAAEVFGIACLGMVFFPPFGFLLGPVALLGPFLLYSVSEASLVGAIAQAALLGVLVGLFWRYRCGPLLLVNVVFSFWWLACGLLAAFTAV